MAVSRAKPRRDALRKRKLSSRHRKPIHSASRERNAKKCAGSSVGDIDCPVQKAANSASLVIDGVRQRKRHVVSPILLDRPLS